MDSKSDHLLEKEKTEFESFAYHCIETFNAYILDNFLESQQQIKDLITSKQNTLSLDNIVISASKRESKRKNLLERLSFKKNEIKKSINNINIDLSQQLEIEKFSSCIRNQMKLCEQHLKDIYNLIKQAKIISANSETDSDEEIEKYTDFISDTETSEAAKFLNNNKLFKKIEGLEKISKFKDLTNKFKNISTINKSETNDHAKSFSDTEQENMFWFKDFLMKKPLKDTTTPEPVQEIDTIIISDDDNSNEKSESINNNEINDQEEIEDTQ
jgi:hypothetical protein